MEFSYKLYIELDSVIAFGLGVEFCLFVEKES